MENKMIDASIALGVKAPQIEDPMNSYAKLMQMQHARQQNQLGMMQMDEYRRGVTEKTNFLNSLREAGDDPLKQQRAYGMAGKLSDWVKMQHEQAQTTELGAKTAGHKVKTAKDTQDFMDAAKRNLSINPSDANVVAWGQDAVIKGFATADQAQAEVNRYLSMTPAQRVAEMRKAGSSVEQLTPKFQTVQTPGGGLRIGSTLDGSFTTNETLAPKIDANTAATINAANDRALKDREQRANQYDPIQYIQTDQGLLAVPKKQQPGVAPSGTRVVGPDGQPLSKPLMAIPAAVQTKIAINNTNLKKAETALALAEGKTVGGLVGDADATGWKGYAPDSLLQRVDEGGIDTRAAIADLGSMIIHERSGAAVTASEFPRLKPFIPTEKDDPPAVRKKLKRFVEIYKEEQKAYREQFSKEAGYGRNEPVSSPQPGVGGVLRFDAQGNPVP
jgi:hypothetical protein